MYFAKINRKNVEFYEAETRCLKKVISVAIYGGPTSVDVQGDMAAITCADRRIYVYENESPRRKQRGIFTGTMFLSPQAAGNLP